MTLTTNRNNIKPMFWFIAGMMILLCLFWAVPTLQRVRSRQFTSYDCITNCIFSFNSFGMSNIKTPSSGFAFFALSITFLIILLREYKFFALLILPPCNLKFFCLRIYFPTRSTPTTISVFCTAIPVKCRKRLDLLAMTTSFNYDYFRHYFLLYRKFCLESVAAHTAVGSLYCIT